ncbi:TetR family transcriptional regulator [Hypnocyclicus thermotrophus]|uniref:TetR family transcriptional regulator n=1 Tax=Hypnocyclicus thermotrophus TaxID=1627895 RepID=A0AA46E0A1_9FUSO|nr:TetR/AcrR family transcriptional regulator [Hypnocyclicus thermotrophus]TDT72376.1 TetR family transcriptional regulator [Hypnocyclicus thermotrophus]
MTKKDKLFIAGKKLFSEKGYEKTSIEEIIKEAAVAKGTFYYYFKSKEEFLEKMFDYIFDEAIKKLEIISIRKDIGATKKLITFLGEMVKMKTQDKEFTEKIARYILEKNFNILIYRFKEIYMEKLSPYLLKIFIEGKETGEFDIDNPEITLGHFLNLLTYAGDPKKMLNNPNYLKEFVYTRQRLVEKVLGLKKGTIRIFEEIFQLNI